MESRKQIKAVEMSTILKKAIFWKPGRPKIRNAEEPNADSLKKREIPQKVPKSLQRSYKQNEIKITNE